MAPRPIPSIIASGNAAAAAADANAQCEHSLHFVLVFCGNTFVSNIRGCAKD